MKKNVITIIVLCFVFSASSVSITSANHDSQPLEQRTNFSSEIYVDNDNTNGPWDGSQEHPYQSIQDGINGANEGDIVYVLNGIYIENPIVPKSIELIGESKEDTIIDGNLIDTTIWIKASYVSLRNFSIINSVNDDHNAGIYAADKRNLTSDWIFDIIISDCIISNNDCGIRLNIVENAIVSNCEIFNNYDHSIYIMHSNNVEIDNCEIYENGELLPDDWYAPGGITTASNDIICKNIEISNCLIYKNVYAAILIDTGTTPVNIHHNTINEHMRGISAESGKSIDVEIHHNTITKSTLYGVEISGPVSAFVHNNLISESGVIGNKDKSAGVCIYNCKSKVTVKNNIISQNKEIGVLLIMCKGNNIVENNFIENDKDVIFNYYNFGESNTLNRNYWDKPRIFPKLIYGRFKTNIIGWIPWFQFDWNPARQSYDIDV